MAMQPLLSNHMFMSKRLKPLFSYKKFMVENPSLEWFIVISTFYASAHRVGVFLKLMFEGGEEEIEGSDVQRVPRGKQTSTAGLP